MHESDHPTWGVRGGPFGGPTYDLVIIWRVGGLWGHFTCFFEILKILFLFFVLGAQALQTCGGACTLREIKNARPCKASGD